MAFSSFFCCNSMQVVGISSLLLIILSLSFGLSNAVANFTVKHSFMQTLHHFLYHAKDLLINNLRFILRILMNFYGTIRPCYITHRGETRVEFCRNDRWNHSKWSLLCCYVLSILCASNHVKHRALDSRYQSEKSLMMIYSEAL